MMKVLDEIKARMNAATAGPWWVLKNALRLSVVYKSEVRATGWSRICYSQNNRFATPNPIHQTNCEFIAAARTDIERLVKALEIAIRQLKDHIEDGC